MFRFVRWCWVSRNYQKHLANTFEKASSICDNPQTQRELIRKYSQIVRQTNSDKRISGFDNSIYFLLNTYILHAINYLHLSIGTHDRPFWSPSLSFSPLASPHFFLMLVAGSELHTITNNTAEVMSHIGMNDVPSYIEFTPCDFDSDIERDPPSCAEDSSFCDDTSRFAEQKIEVIKPSQQDVEAPYYNMMPAHMTRYHKCQRS